MSPRTGRPTDDPKPIRMEVRLTEERQQRLDYCAEILELPKAEVIRQGIDEMYIKAQKQAKK